MGLEAAHGARRPAAGRVHQKDALRTPPRVEEKVGARVLLEDEDAGRRALPEEARHLEPGGVVAAVAVAHADEERAGHVSSPREPQEVRGAGDARVVVPDGLLAPPEELGFRQVQALGDEPP
jgi:hypothetical protein